MGTGPHPAHTVDAVYPGGTSPRSRIRRVMTAWAKASRRAGVGQARVALTPIVVGALTFREIDPPLLTKTDPPALSGIVFY
jgi:hypothetical protein